MTTDFNGNPILVLTVSEAVAVKDAINYLQEIDATLPFENQLLEKVNKFLDEI